MAQDSADRAGTDGSGWSAPVRVAAGALRFLACQPWALWPGPTRRWAPRFFRPFCRGQPGRLRRRWTPSYYDQVRDELLQVDAWAAVPDLHDEAAEQAELLRYRGYACGGPAEPGGRRRVTPVVRSMGRIRSGPRPHPRLAAAQGPGAETPRRPSDSIWCASSSIRWRATPCCSRRCARPSWHWSPPCCGLRWPSRATSPRSIIRRAVWSKRSLSAVFGSTTSFRQALRPSWRRCAPVSASSMPVLGRPAALRSGAARSVCGLGARRERRKGGAGAPDPGLALCRSAPGAGRPDRLGNQPAPRCVQCTRAGARFSLWHLVTGHRLGRAEARRAGV